MDKISIFSLILNFQDNTCFGTLEYSAMKFSFQNIPGVILMFR